MQTLTLSVLVTVGLVELVLGGWMIRGFRRQQALERRMDALTGALSLLTETSEAGFRAGALEVARLADHLATRRVPAQKAAGGRAARARGRGRTMEQLAADEQVSEGEMHLRLALRDQGASAAPATGAERRNPAQRLAIPENTYA